MKIVKIVFENGYVANYDNEHIYIMEDDYTDSQLGLIIADDFASFCEDNMLGVQGYDFYNGWESEEDEQDYYDNCTWYPEEITLKELEEWCKDNAFDYDEWVDTYNEYRKQLGLDPIIMEKEEEEEQIKPTFRVTVSYTIDITAEDADDAMDKAEKLIQDGEVYPTDIEWDTID